MLYVSWFRFKACLCKQRVEWYSMAANSACCVAGQTPALSSGAVHGRFVLHHGTYHQQCHCVMHACMCVDGVGDYAMCWQIDTCLESPAVLSQILASMTQTHGLTQGWLFDPVTLTPLTNNEAMLKALQLLQGLQNYTWPGRSS